MTIEQLLTQLLRRFPNKTVYLLNPDGEIDEKTTVKDLLARVIVGEKNAKRLIRRYCAYCQASMIGKETCPLCQRPTKEMTEKLVPVKHIL